MSQSYDPNHGAEGDSPEPDVHSDRSLQATLDRAKELLEEARGRAGELLDKAKDKMQHRDDAKHGVTREYGAISIESEQEVVARLNEWARNGWRLVTAVPGDPERHRALLIMEREAPAAVSTADAPSEGEAA